MSFLSTIPPPIRIIGLTVAGLLLLQLSRYAGGLTVVVAVVLWALVLLSWLYATGLIPAIANVPGLGPAAVWLTAPQSRVRTGVSPSGGGGGTATSVASQSITPPPTAARDLNDEERSALFNQALASIESLRGIEGPLSEINNLIALARAQRARGRSGLGVSAPGVLLLLGGPRGTGKSELASQLGRLFCGLGVIQSDRLVRARQGDFAAGYGANIRESIGTLALAALDGTLLFEDADWFTDSDRVLQTSPGLEAGETLLRVAEEYPGRLFVVMTLSSAKLNSLANDPRHRAWHGKLFVRAIQFEHLSDEVLLDLLIANLQSQGYALDDSAMRTARLRIRDARSEAGQEFDNLIAVRKIVNESIQRVAVRAPDSTVMTADDLRDE